MDRNDAKDTGNDELSVLQAEIGMLETENRNLLKQKSEQLPHNSVLSLAYKLYVSDSLPNTVGSPNHQTESSLTPIESLKLKKHLSQSTNTDFNFFPNDSDIRRADSSSSITKDLQLLDKMNGVVSNPQLLKIIKENTKKSSKKKRKLNSSASDLSVKNQVISFYKTQNWIDSFISQKLYRMFGVTFFPINNPSSSTVNNNPYLVGIRFDLYDPQSRKFNPSPDYIILKTVELENKKQTTSDKKTLVIFKHTIPNYIQLSLLEKQYLRSYDVPQVFQFAKTVSSHLRHVQRKKSLFLRIGEKYDQQQISSDKGRISVQILCDYAQSNAHFAISFTGHEKSIPSNIIKFEIIMDLTNITNVILLQEDEEKDFLPTAGKYLVPFSQGTTEADSEKVSLSLYLKKLFTCSYESFEVNFDDFIEQYKAKVSGSNL